MNLLCLYVCNEMHNSWDPVYFCSALSTNGSIQHMNPNFHSPSEFGTVVRMSLFLTDFLFFVLGGRGDWGASG